MASPGRPQPCAVCAAVPPERRLELDLMMGDPGRWPKAIWGVFDLPDGPNVPPVMREWGALEVGVAWLAENGWGDLNKAHVRNHYERHVTLIPQDMAAAGAATEGKATPDPVTDPLAYLRFYVKGIEVGRKGLELLSRHVERILEKNPEAEIPLSLIKMMVDAGAKLAVSQAMIKSREKSVPDELGDEDDGFRAAPGPKFEHTRIREVAGEARPVHDEGPADRARYNARADQEGGERI